MHGRPRAKQASNSARQKHEEAKIASFQALMQQVLQNHRRRNFSKEALLQNATLLETNPEVYTAWNYRKLAVIHLLESEDEEAARKAILDTELHVIERALLRNFKSYGAWHHRKWVLNFGLSSLDHEYRLLDKLLTSDARNFHGWAYRRFLARIKGATEEQELQYTIKKINENFSNYSAWHSRSVLLSKQLLDNAIEQDIWLKVLSEEYDLVKQAFFTEPEDQSGWFYLTWLLGQTVLPSCPSLVGFWPHNGASIVSNLKALSLTRFQIILCFDIPVTGVNTETVSAKLLSPQESSLEFGLLWNSVPANLPFCKTWVGIPVDFSKCLEAGASLTCQVEVGARSGIVSKDGPISNVQQFSFNLEVTNSGSPAYEDNDVLDVPVVWPEDLKQGFSRCDQLVKDLFKDDLLHCQSHHEPLSGWQEEMLTAQIDTCRELLDLEQDSKWAMLMLARLLVAHDQFASSTECHMDEVERLYKGLMKVDPTHGCYYDEQLSLHIFDQITSSSHNLSNHCWTLYPNQERWIRFNSLSLSKLRYCERLIGVQRLDLSNNKLRSLEGIEMLQLLIYLDISHNCVASITALQPVSFLPRLEALNMKWNEVGQHPIDTNRYISFTALNNSAESVSIEKVGDEKCPVQWEVLEVFSRMALHQLDIHGNPISANERFRCQLLHALPSLVWLDGERVSS